MNSLKINNYWLLIFFVLTVKSYSQISNPSIKLTLPAVTPVTPDAANMAKFVSTPIDYSTGKINLTIPLYTIKVGDIELPISLTYNCDGLKPREPNGRVGYGWILNAEPSVTRIVNGAPDDHSSFFERLCGYKYENVGYLDPILDSAYIRMMFEKKVDQEPDKYAYQIINGGGTAMIPRSGRVFAYSFPKNFEKFEYAEKPIIRDKNGYIYEMGGSEDYVEKYFDNIVRFMCSSIKSSKTSANITFSYDSRYYTFLSPNLKNSVTIEDRNNMETQILQVDNLDNFNSTYQVASGYLIPLGTNFNPGLERRFLESTFKGKFLNQIKFDNGKVQFIWNGQVLESIKVYNKSEVLIRYVNFFISKYNTNTDIMKLDSVSIGAPDCELQTYRMRYFSPDFVPAADTKGLDHWGYYNGTNPQSTVPLSTVESYTSSNQIITHTIGSADKTSNGAYAIYGMLSELKNPQGIKTVYGYEANQTAYYASYDAPLTIVPVGGLHIETVRDYTKDGDIYQNRSFNYLNKEGAFQNLTNIAYVRKPIITSDDYCLIQTKHTILWNSSVFKTVRLRTWASQPYSNITFENGSVAMYDTIVEYISSGNPNYATYKNTYSYRAPTRRPVIDNVQQTRNLEVPFEFDENHEWYNYGQLLEVSNYRNDILFKKTQYVYDEINKFSYINDYLNTRKAYQTHIFEGGPGFPDNCNKYNYIEYDYPTYDYLIKQVITTEPTQNGTIKSLKEYTYDGINNHSNPTKETIVNSDGVKVETKFNYFEDLETYPEELNRDSLLAFNILSEPCEIKKITGTDTLYQRVLFSNCKPASVKTKTVPGSKFNTVLNYNYDSYGNICEVYSNDNKRICFIWSYNNQYPIARIENISYDNLLAALSKDRAWITTLGNKIEPDLADKNLINSLRQTLSDSFVSTYTYDPLIGQSSFTDPRGKKIKYSFDKLNRFKISYEDYNNTFNVLQINDYFFGNQKSGNW